MNEQHTHIYIPIGRTEPDCDLRHICVAAAMERTINQLIADRVTEVRVDWINRPDFPDGLIAPDARDHAYRIYARRGKPTRGKI